MIDLSDYQDVANFCAPEYWETCPAWVQKHIDLSLDNTCDAIGTVDLSYTPYVVEPLSFFEREYRSRLTVVAIEQTGKSSVWKFGTLFKHTHSPSPTLIIYPSDQDAKDTNEDSFRPLMTGIPRLKLELDRPRMERKDRFGFSFSPIYFNGGGADIISKPMGLVIGDEVDFWMQHFEQVDNVKNLEKRTRTFKRALMVLVCSINQKKAKTSIIWRSFGESSQGYWHLKCPACNNHTIRSANIELLEWENYDNGDVIESSIRLKCPDCKKEFDESNKRQMNIEGKYIHVFPQRFKDHEGNQWGALGSQMPGIRWLDAAKAITTAGRSNNLEDKLFLWNSFKGLPLDLKVSDPLKQLLLSHVAELPDPAIIEAVFMSVDTQDDCFYYRIRGIDSEMNKYSLTPDIRANSFDELDKAWNAEYMGIRPIMGIADLGGHRSPDVKAWMKGKKHFYGYRGYSRAADPYQLEEGSSNIYLANPAPLQQDLLYHMYNQHDKSNNYWYLHPREMEEYYRQMLDVRSEKDETTKQDKPYPEWKSQTRNDHCFDCEKMFFLLFKLAKKKLEPGDWRLGKIKGIAPVKRPVPVVRPPNSLFNTGGFKKTSLF